MSKVKRENRDIVKHPSSNTNLPEWLQEESAKDESLSSMKEYRVLPRLKIVQSTADGDTLAEFDPGCCIIKPGNVLLSLVDKKMKKGSPFLFVPVFFFPEFLKWADLKDKDNPTIMERSLDPNSELARKCKNVNAREEEYDGGTARYCEHLNFAGFIYDKESELSGQIICISFSRGEFSQGRNWISAITMRKAPLWSQVWRLSSSFRDRGADRKWWGLDFASNEEQPFILENEVEFFKSSFLELKELHEANKVGVDLSEEHSESDDSSESKEF